MECLLPICCVNAAYRCSRIDSRLHVRACVSSKIAMLLATARRLEKSSPAMQRICYCPLPPQQATIMSDTDWSEVSSKKTKNRPSTSFGASATPSASFRVAPLAGVKTGTGRKAPVPQGKVFVGGLSWDTDEDSLHDYFSKYGELCALEIPRGENKVIAQNVYIDTRFS